MAIIGLGVVPPASVFHEDDASTMADTLRLTWICPLTAAAAAVSMRSLKTNARIAVVDSSDAPPGRHAEQNTPATPLAVE